MTKRRDIANPFSEYLAGYAESVAANFRQHVAAAPEDQLKAPVGDLVNAMGRMMGHAVDYRTEVLVDNIEGRPDLGITLDGQLIGVIELKAPGEGARPETFTGRNREQWERFKAFPNLIYTDGAEWSLYQNGEYLSRVSITDDIRNGGKRALIAKELRSLEKLFRLFLEWGPTAPATAQGLANYLAPLTRILRDDVTSSLSQPYSPLPELVREWEGLLFPEGNDAQFADAYAQTLTYALLLARFEGADQLRPAFASEALRRWHGLLAEALQLLEVDSVREELLLPIQLLERAIKAVDTIQLKQHGDPWLYFYEYFLGAYDPKLRSDRGVFYTPSQVVRAQTQLVAELLHTRFGKPLAFADDGVNVLDPAAGTGAYLLSVIDNAISAVRRRYGDGAVRDRIAGLADRLFGLEVLVGPYAVTHLRLTQKFQEAGAREKPPMVYLADTLESPHRPPEFRRTIMQEQMALQRQVAQTLKRDTPILVCIGNPPYDREQRDPAEDDKSRRKGGWVRYGGGDEMDRPILDDFIAPVLEAGGGIHLKNLYNDYVYFWRWALWKLFESNSVDNSGVISFITASSYLRGPAFAGMRRKMREVFDELWIIDLEGDSLGARKSENVFAIRTPVAIAVGVRDGGASSGQPAKVWKVRLTGTTEAKLARLDEISGFGDLPWQECAMEWDAPFYARESGVFFDWPAVTDVFPCQVSGCKTHRTWVIGANSEVLERRWTSLLALTVDERRAAFKETRDRKIHKQYAPLIGSAPREPSIEILHSGDLVPTLATYAYRSFDRQRLIADSRMGDFMNPSLWRAHGPEQVYITSLLTNVLGEGPGATATAAIPDLDHFRGSFGAKHVIPLWRDASATQPNITGGLLARLSAEYDAPVTAERLFAYAYGILAQPAYVERFWDELEQPPPRLPLTKDAALFDRAADLGARLLGLHTYGERYGGSVPQGEARCTKAVSPGALPRRSTPTTR